MCGKLSLGLERKFSFFGSFVNGSFRGRAGNTRQITLPVEPSYQMRELTRFIPCYLSNDQSSETNNDMFHLEMCSAVGKWAEGSSGALKTSEEQCVHKFEG